MPDPLPQPLLPPLEEAPADPQVALLFDEIRDRTGLPFVQGLMRSLAHSPAALTVHWRLLDSVREQSTLPRSLTAMILYVVASTGGSDYGRAREAFNCRTLGIDPETLHALLDETEPLSPRRMRDVINFALKVATAPHDLSAADLDALRRQGIGDAELLQVIQLVALGSYLDTLAEALHLPLDPPYVAP